MYASFGSLETLANFAEGEFAPSEARRFSKRDSGGERGETPFVKTSKNIYEDFENPKNPI
jgi:hypothetical protein